MTNPAIIQGGMGVGISSWRLARAVSGLGQLGVVSGTALDQVFARRLQDGDPGGHMRHGLDHFPCHGIAERVWSTYYIPGGKPEKASYRKLPIELGADMRPLWELCMAANFVEVFWLARDIVTRSASTIWKRYGFPTCRLSMARCWPGSTTSSWAPAFP